MCDLSDALDRAEAVLGSRARREVPLGERTTYRVGGAARLFVEAGSVDDVVAVGAAHRASGLPVLAVGRGSNLLVADAGFDGIALVLGERFATIDVSHRPQGGVLVTAGAAVPMPVLARRTVADGLSGLEWMVGVPGSVGGAVRMNAGGHGDDVAGRLVSVDVVDLATDVGQTLEPSALGLRFRGSALGASVVVTSAVFGLEPGNTERGEAMLTEIVRWRRDNQPGGQNAGSVFVNPFDGADSAGRLIDEAGMRGHRHGTAVVSSKHANFIQADADGSADDVYSLMCLVADAVRDTHGIDLRSEVKLIGFNSDRFDHAGPHTGSSHTPLDKHTPPDKHSGS